MIAVLVVAGLMVVACVLAAAGGASAEEPRKEVQQEEWLTVKNSGIAHRFAIVPQMNQQYRYSVCGFETQADRLSEDQGRTCAKCERSKGW